MDTADTLVQKDDKGLNRSQDEPRPRESEVMLNTSFIQRHLEEEAVQKTNIFTGAIYS